MISEFAFQLFDFDFQPLVFRHFAFEESPSKPGLFFDALGGQKVDVGFLAGVTLEVTRLHLAFFDKGAEAIVGFSQADIQRPGELALTDIGLCLDELEDAVVDFVVGHVSLVHWWAMPLYPLGKPYRKSLFTG